MGLCAVSRGVKGVRNKGKAQLSSALDQISERITVPPRSNPESIIESVNLPYISIGYGGESVSQSPLKRKAFLTFLGQNPPFELRRKLAFRLQSWLIQVLAQPSIQQDWLASAFRRQRSHGSPAFLLYSWICAPGPKLQLCLIRASILRTIYHELRVVCRSASRQRRPSAQSQLFDPSSLRISSANRFWQSFEPS
jgi:hypothetical protein